jgi:modulator of FtsH protease
MGYEVDGWHDLFVASAGAAAALAGLVFVALSINIERILQYAWLPSRALRTVMLLIGVVVACVFGLVPQSTDALGVELLATGAILASALVRSALTNRGSRDVTHSGPVAQISIEVLGSVPLAIGGLTLLIGSGGGLYWVLAGILCAIVGAVLNAWVLMVEILR